MACVKANVKLKDIADKMGISSSVLTYRLNTGKFTIEEQQTVAEALGCKFVVKMVFDDGTEISGNTSNEMIRAAYAHANITQVELAQRLGKTRQAVNSKIQKGKFTGDEFKEYADKIGCNFESYFEFTDGTQI